MSNSRFQYKVWDKQENKFLVRVRKFDFHLMPDGFLEVSSGYDSYKNPTFEDDTDQDRYIVLWFTGLKDNKDNPIYEGDIVNCDDFDGISATTGLIGEVTYIGGSFGVVSDDTYHNKLALTCAPNVEILGNIHQNPELLNR
jgi:uncharacterized phage protein (TIGR01671 family)